MTVAAITFGVVFLAEPADTSALATLVLSTRFPARWVLLGVFAGMVVHVAVALLAGSLVALPCPRSRSTEVTACSAWCRCDG